MSSEQNAAKNRSQPEPHQMDSCQLFSAGEVRTLLRQNPANEVVAVRLYVRGGSANLTPELAGTEALYGRTARRGTRRYPKEKLNAELARMAADLSTSAGEDGTVFSLRCLRRHFDATWDILTDVILAPLLEAQELDVVRRQMLMEIRQHRDSPDGRLGELARDQSYRNHPYQIDPGGTESALPGLDADRLRDHVHKRFVRRRLLLVVIGDVTREELEPRVVQAFARLESGDSLHPVPALRFEDTQLLVESRQLPTNYIMGQFSVPALCDPGYPATLLAMSILRDRLFEEVRTKRNLSYAPAAGMGNNAANLGWIYVTAVDPITTMRVMLDEMRKLREVPLNAKDLQDKVQVYLTRYYMQNESAQAQARFLASYELLGGGWQRAEGFVARLEALQPDDVQQAARAALQKIQYTYLGNADRADASVFVDP